MLSENKKSLLQQLVHNATTEEIIWISGYLQGYSDNEATKSVGTIVPAVALKPTIIYGTETGNSKKVTSQLLTTFKKNKIQAKAIDVFQYDIAKLEKETLALFVMSTQGEGEFPQNAVSFYEKLKASTADLSQLKFAVLGLGDTSYPLYCYAGELLDEALAKLGAKRLLPLVKVDVDYAAAVADWEKDLLHIFENNTTSQSTVSREIVKSPGTSNKKNYTGIISHKIVLNDRGSNKETYHIEITGNEAIEYEPGDALGIFAKNAEYTIQQVLSYFKEDGQRNVTIKDKTLPIHSWLAERNIKGLSKRSVLQIAALLETTYDAEKADLLDILAIVAIP